MAQDSFFKTAVPLVVMTFIGVYKLTPMSPEQQAAAAAAAARAQQVEKSVYYAGCNDVRALGKDPLYRGDPGYRDGMDGDRDGIACEPYRDGN
jgi:Excalibur calcium-binding domain